MHDCGVVAWWANCDIVDLDTVSSDHMGPGVLQTKEKDTYMLCDFLNNICQGLQLLEPCHGGMRWAHGYDVQGTQEWVGGTCCQRAGPWMIVDNCLLN